MADRLPPWRERAQHAFRNPGLVIRRLVPARLHYLLDAFWLVPLALAIFGVAAPPVLYLVDDIRLAGMLGGILPEIDPSGARDALSAVAGGVITLTSLLFSLMFVALSIAAQQLSPRVLDYVVEERATQLVTGLAFSTFLFAAITLAFGSAGGETRLALSAFVALAMAAATLGMVVVFTHRMTRIMRAEDMVTWLGAGFTEAIRRGPRSITGEMMVTEAEEESALGRRMEGARTVAATKTGYLGAVDYPGLLAWAEENDLLVEILVRENAFVLEGQPMARIVWPGGADADADGDAAGRITYHVNLTERRAIGETPEYQGSSLSEVALRALSPGINDPATARACANQLYAGLVMLAALPERPLALKGGDGVPRILRARHGIAEFLEAVVAPIVESARDRTTLRHLADLTETLGGIAGRSSERAAIEALARRIAERDDPPAERHLGDTAEEPPARSDDVDDAGPEPER